MTSTETDARPLLASLDRMGLLAPGEVPVLEPLTGGVSSLIVLAHTRAGPLVVKTALAQLKVAAQWLAPVERNTAEVAWLRVAAEIVPNRVPAVLGEDREGRAYAMAYLAPAQYPVWKTALLAGEADPQVAIDVARAIVRIHSASAHRAELAAAFANDASFFALRLDPYLGAAARAHPNCAGALHELIATTARHKTTLVHGDVSPKNILCGAHGPVILDAECAWYGDPAFDLAFVLNHLLLKCAWRPASAPAYLASFDALRHTYCAGIDWEPPDALEQRTARLLAGLLLARIDGKSPVEYLTTPAQREPVRAVARALLLTPPASLDAVRQAWRAVC